MTGNRIMLERLSLPRADGTLAQYAQEREPLTVTPAAPPRTRIAYAAAHVVSDPLADNEPTLDVALDWEATLAYRRHLWALGFCVAEAMDTAQRSMGLDWRTAEELIHRSVAEARAVGAGDRIACGAGTDHLEVSPSVTLQHVSEAYERQCASVEDAGGHVILMASRALAAVASGPEDYAKVYGETLSRLSEPAILHWLGEDFDPALAGYWGHEDLDLAMESCLSIIREHAPKVDGIKISLLDAEREIEMRRRLPADVRMYTGDDFAYPQLILGDQEGYSDALLGIFDAIAPAASTALHALDAGDEEGYLRVLEPTVPLSRHIFQSPTRFYKTGVVFLAYLNGHQDHFRMVGGQEGARSVVHLSELFVLADKAGLLADPEMAVRRMRPVLDLAGLP
jgi:hypothetical protein